MRFGTIRRELPKHVRRHGDAVIIRSPFSHQERFWTIVCSLLGMLVLAIIIRAATNQPPGQPTPDWIGAPATAMAFPLLIIVIALAMPQRTLRISSSAISFGSTFRLARRRVRFDEINGVSPGFHRIRVSGRTICVPCRAFPSRVRKELHQQLESHLARRFDLSQPTRFQQRLARTRQRWTWPWFVDRLALLGMALSFMAMGLSKCLCGTHPLLAFSILGVFGSIVLACVAVSAQRTERDNWHDMRIESSAPTPGKSGAM